jgi:hypothetical protein
MCKTRIGGMAQAVEHLPSKCEALNSSLSTTKKEINSYFSKNQTGAQGQQCTPVILTTQEAEIRIMVRIQPAWVNISQNSILIPNTKRAGRMAQVIECLLCKHKALSSSPNTDHPQKIEQNYHMIQ